tara:strand:+ start:30869 stop:31723 length:855 start_codon:yes stop_codon:yes gene_type:complete
MTRTRAQTSAALAAILTTIVAVAPAVAQDHDQASHSEHGAAHNEPQDIVRELAALRARVAQLEAVLQLGHRPVTAEDQSTPTHKGHGSKDGHGAGDGQRMDMGMGKDMGKDMGMGRAMATDGAMAMGGMRGMRGMMGMGPKAKDQGGATDAMVVRTDLPGFPGASHLYHIGATGFFLDHAEHIGLTSDQQVRLNTKMQQTLLAQSEHDRRIERLEETLWSLTAASTPDIERIEEAVRAIESERAEKRLAFIRAVGEAAKVLTDEQRQTLAGARPVDMAGQGEGD